MYVNFLQVNLNEFLIDKYVFIEKYLCDSKYHYLFKYYTTILDAYNITVIEHVIGKTSCDCQD